MSSSPPSDTGAAAGGEVVVGIGCYNDAGTIGAVARAAREALQRLSCRGRIVVADGGSSDQTVARAQQAIGDTCPLSVVDYHRGATDALRAPYHGLEGRPAARHTARGGRPSTPP